MKQGEQIRNLSLAITLLGAVLVLGKVLLTPNQKPQTITYSFPQQIPLDNWQFERSDAIDVQRLQGPALMTSVDDLAIAARNYRYSRNGQQLNIEMRYFNTDTYVDVSTILRDSNLPRVKPDTIAQESDQGSYVLFTESGTQYLSACIAPTTRTTATESDFRREQNSPQVIAHRVFPWLLGFAPLRDMRCLWTKISIQPVKSNTASVSATNSGSESVQQQELKQVWSQWAQWWQKHYPPEP